MGENKEKKGVNMSAKSFVTAIVVIFLLMVLTYGLTFIVPGGYIPFWKWLLSPILVLGSEDNVSLIAVLLFLLVIGGVFNCLDKCGLMKYMLDMITDKFGKKKVRLLAIVTLFFMAMGSFIGSFEECVPLVPIVVALAVRLGWDVLAGLGMSILAIGCGFAAGICNPFTVGVAQELAGLAMFSGMWFRMIVFVVVYLLLFGFLYRYARKIEKADTYEMEAVQFQKDGSMQKSLLSFVGLMVGGILVVLCSIFIPALQGLTIIIVAVTFLASGLIATILSKRGGNIRRTFLNGVTSVMPGVIMILMANSIKFTLVEAGILEPILQGAIQVAETLPRWGVILFIYMIALFTNFFISSGSAKAFLLMPLIVPVAEAFGISAQLCVVAYAFGDGFSNVFYPTNPVLLISLGIVGVDYGKWAKWSWKFQAMNLVLTSGILLLGLAIGY